MSRKQILIALGVVLAIALAAGAFYGLPVKTAAATAATPGGGGYEITPTDHTMGDPKAKVVLIEYAAPRCPHCAHFNADIFPAVKQNYIDTGKVFYVFRVYPLAPEDGAAEKIARCLPKDKYFSFMDLLFRNQPKWDPEYGVLDVHGGLAQMAQMAGMSAADMDKCLAATTEDEKINKIASDGQARYAIEGTPTFVVNGTVQGRGTVPDYPQMQKFLDDALAAKH